MTKPPRKSDPSYPHTAQDIDTAFGALVYELVSFLRDGKDLLEGKTGDWQTEVLEAYLIHARVLITFLGANGRIESDDVTPGNFGVTWTWPSTPEAAEIEKQSKPINKHLAHLTRERTMVSGGAQWNPLTLIDLLIPIFNQFVAALKISDPKHARALEANIKVILG